MANNLRIPKEDTDAVFDRLAPVLRPSDLQKVIERHRTSWCIPSSLHARDFAHWLVRHTKLKCLVLKSDVCQPIQRYTWGEVAPVLIALSLSSHAYLSHGSALWVHGLGGRERSLYVNEEQREKPPNLSTIEQEALDRTFRNPPRHTRKIYRFSRSEITVLNGKFTDRLGVVEIATPSGDVAPVTSVERTLIDITVRPNYAGDVTQVARAFAAAREKVSVESMVDMLRKLDHKYPYHQAIGFYLKHAGYSVTDQRQFARLGIRLNFYLSYAMSDAEFDEDWRVWYPRALSRKVRHHALR